MHSDTGKPFRDIWRPSATAADAVKDVLRRPLPVILWLGLLPSSWIALCSELAERAGRVPGVISTRELGSVAVFLVTAVGWGLILGGQARYALGHVRNEAAHPAVLLPRLGSDLRVIAAVIASLVVATAPRWLASSIDTGSGLRIAILSVVFAAALLVMVRAFLWGPILVDSGVGLVAGFRRSVQLTHGHGTRVVGLFLLLGLPTLAIFVAASHSPVALLVASAVVQPVLTLSWCRTYTAISDRAEPKDRGNAEPT